MLTRLDLSRLALWAGLTLLPACGDDPGTGPTATVAAVRVSPAAQTVVIGRSVELTAVAVTAAGQPVSGRPVTWSLTDSSVAAVSQAGFVTAHSEGETTVRATVDGKVGTAVLLVVSPTVESVDLDRTVLQLEEGTADQLAATPRDADGAAIAGRHVAWESSNPGVVAISVLGELTALRPGTATISARVQGKTATATITVTAAYGFDLLYSGWSGTAGEGPELQLVDPRDAQRTASPVRPDGLTGLNPAPSPDGTRIAFAAVDPWAHTDLYVLDRTTGVVTQLTSGNAFDDQPSWSPDGTRIAFRRQLPGEGGQIWVMNAAAGATPIKLSAGVSATAGQVAGSVPIPFSYSSPAWSLAPAGGAPRIAYVRSYAGLSHIWTMAEDGSDRRQVTTGQTFDDQPAWSPDGTTLAFTRYGLTSDIWMIDASGLNPRVLVDLPMQQSRPAFSPDGRLVAFVSSSESGHAEIFTVWASGNRRLAQRTSDQTDKQSVSWVRRP